MGDFVLDILIGEDKVSLQSLINDSEAENRVELALADLLIRGQVFLNSYHWEKGWPIEARAVPSINVNCNDVFMWGCADAEDVKHEEIMDLHGHFTKDPSWGGVVWCIKKRKMMPQRPVKEVIDEAGFWNLDEMGLEKNPTDGGFND